MVRIIFLMALSFSFSAVATFSQERPDKVNKRIERTWKGTIIFNDDRQIDCKFTYNPLVPEGLLLVKTDSMSYALGPTAVKSFSFLDDEENRTRYFYSLRINDATNKKYFLELIHTSNKVSILGRNTIARKTYYNRQTGYSSFKIINYDEKILLNHDDDQWYVMNARGLEKITSDKAYEISWFIKTHNINLYKNKVEDYIAIVDYYSALKN